MHRVSFNLWTPSFTNWFCFLCLFDDHWSVLPAEIEIINDGSTEVVREINAFNACPRLDWTLIEPWKTEKFHHWFFVDFTWIAPWKTHRKAGRTGRLPHPYGKAVLVAHGLLPQWIGWVGAPWPRESITYTLHYNTNTNTKQYNTIQIQIQYNTIQYIHRTYTYIYI